MHLGKCIKTVKCASDNFPSNTLQCAICWAVVTAEGPQTISGQLHNLQLLLPLLPSKHLKGISLIPMSSKVMKKTSTLSMAKALRLMTTATLLTPIKANMRDKEREYTMKIMAIGAKLLSVMRQVGLGRKQGWK